MSPLTSRPPRRRRMRPLLRRRRRSRPPRRPPTRPEPLKVPEPFPFPFVGLTGGLGSGKSTALQALERLGAATLSTDAVVHELYATDEVRDLVVARWGADVAPAGAVDRAAI